MRRLLLVGVFLFAATAIAQAPRPKILGISSVTFHTSNPDAAHSFYGALLGLKPWRTSARVDHYLLSSTQSINIDREPAKSLNRLEEEIAFEVENVGAMKKYLNEHGISDLHAENARGFWITGPESLRIGFAQRSSNVAPQILGGPIASKPLDAPSTRIIHVGFVVHDRAAAEKFFRDLLGFKLYWTGGPNWDGTEAHRAYMSYQVPDGHEWVEFMLNRPANMDAKGYGSANHVALGVTDIQKAREQLVKNGWTGTAEPRQGQDGKWQLNLFDPDGTRIELMEFTPKREPCCTPYQQPHPSPNDR